MRTNTLHGDYYELGTSGQYSRHKQIKVNYHLNDVALDKRQKFKINEIGKQKQIVMSNNSSPRFNQYQQKQCKYSSRLQKIKKQGQKPRTNSQLISHYRALSNSQHTQPSSFTQQQSVNKLKSILKRSINSEFQFASKQEKSVENFKEELKKDSLRQKNVGQQRSQNCERILNNSSANSQISDECEKNLKLHKPKELAVDDRQEKSLERSHRRKRQHHRNKSNNFFCEKQKSQERKIRNSSVSKAENKQICCISQKNRNFSHGNSIDDEQQLFYLPLQSSLNHRKQLDQSKQRNIRPSRSRQMTENDRFSYKKTKINTHIKKHKNHFHSTNQSNLPINDYTTLYNCPTEIYQNSQYFQQDEDSNYQFECDSYYAKIANRIEKLDQKMAGIQEQAIKSQYRIMKYQLMREIENKEKIMRDLMEDNLRIKKQNERNARDYQQSQEKVNIADIAKMKQISPKVPFIAGLLSVLFIFMIIFKNTGTGTCS